MGMLANPYGGQVRAVTFAQQAADCRVGDKDVSNVFHCQPLTVGLGQFAAQP